MCGVKLKNTLVNRCLRVFDLKYCYFVLYVIKSSSIKTNIDYGTKYY